MRILETHIMNICVYPSGAWGTAFALHCQRVGHTTTLVSFEMEEALTMTTQRENVARLPGCPLPQDLQIGTELLPALMEADGVILASASKHLGEAARAIAEARREATRLRWVVTLCKGLEPGKNRLPEDVVKEHLPDLAYGVISGPTFASQVARGRPSALVLGMEDDTLAETLQEALSSSDLRIYRTNDVKGVELGGCLKNVYAIAAGQCDGLGLGDNSKAALLTRALHEMVRVGLTFGGSRETFYGLSGFGDLVLTCNGQESRNRTFGEAFAKGRSSNEILAEGTTVEGYHTARCFHELCAEHKIDAPILREVYETLYEGKPVEKALRTLMAREPKPEHL